MNFEATKACAIELDKKDKLAPFRNRFRIPSGRQGKPLIYLCGNSLGLQPIDVREKLDDILKTWAEKGVGGFTEPAAPWMSLHDSQLDVMSELTNARPDELLLMNTLSVNLHLMLVSFYRPDNKRYKVMIEQGAFPSDRYAVCSQIRQRGLKIEDALIEVPPDANGVLNEDGICRAIEREGDELALVFFGGVGYYTGQVLDMAPITRCAHRKGAMIGFDLAHGVGNIGLSLHNWGVDFAVWCHYKYMNAGPGAVGGAFVHEKHHTDVGDRFEGWWGTDPGKRFLMPPEFHPAAGAAAWKISTDQILPLAALSASTDIYREAGFENLRRKSEQLTAYLSFLLDQLKAISVITPAEQSRRGAQLSLRVKDNNGRQLFDQISRSDVVVDWREPDVIRVAPVPLYNTFGELFSFFHLLKDFTKH